MESKFGRRLETARHDKHLTRAQLSAKAGISESVLRDMEIRNSATRQVYDVLPKLADILNVSLLWLLTGKESATVDRIVKHVDVIKAQADQIINSVRN